MNNNLQLLKDILLQNKEILIVLSPHFNEDALVSASSLFYSLKQIEQEGPVFNIVDFLIPTDLTNDQKLLLGDGILKYVKNTLDQKSYIISVPKDGKVDKVKWREENDSFKLFLTSAYGDLNIQDLKFEEVGSSYKYVILFGVEDLNELGNLYQNNKSFFDRVPKAILGAKDNDVDGSLIKIAKKTSYMNLVYEFFNILNIKKNSTMAQMLLDGYVRSINGSLSNVQNREILDKIGDLLDLGANLKSLGGSIIEKESYSMFQLKQRIFANVRQDNSGILWSTVESSELRDLQIDDTEINFSKPIPFNSYHGYDNAFVLYELKDGTTCGKVETENLDLPKVLKEFEMNVCTDGLVIRSDDNLRTVESKLLTLLGSGNVDKSFDSENVSVTDVKKIEPVVGELVSSDDSIDIFSKSNESSNLVDTKASDEPLQVVSQKNENEESFTEDPIVGGDNDSFGPPKIFSGGFGGPFSGMSKSK